MTQDSKPPQNRQTGISNLAKRTKLSQNWGTSNRIVLGTTQMSEISQYEETKPGHTGIGQTGHPNGPVTSGRTRTQPPSSHCPSNPMLLACLRACQVPHHQVISLPNVTRTPASLPHRHTHPRDQHIPACPPHTRVRLSQTRPAPTREHMHIHDIYDMHHMSNPSWRYQNWIYHIYDI
jgi:hypothetical protein